MFLLYRFIKIWLFPIFRFFFRRIYFSNKNRIPEGKPVILASNHPNSFLDGVAISYLMLRKTFVLVRGDVFNKNWANKILLSMCLLPIYRGTDGEDKRANWDKNNITFDNCYQIFKNNGVVLIFSEAIAKIERRLRPLKKGTARLAFDSMERSNWTMDLQIVPTSVNYSHFLGFRKEILIDFCKPIRVADYKEMYEENGQAAINQLTQDIESVLKENLVICENPLQDEYFEIHSEIVRNSTRKPFFGFWFKTEAPLNSERIAAKSFNIYMKDEVSSGKLTAVMKKYQNELNRKDLKDKAFVSGNGIVWKSVFALIFAIPALAGMLSQWLPYLLASIYTPKVVKKREFYDSILLGFSLVFDIIYTLLAMLILISFFGWLGLLVIIVIKFLGILSLFVWEAWQDLFQFVRINMLKVTKPAEYNELLNMRLQILNLQIK